MHNPIPPAAAAIWLAIAGGAAQAQSDEPPPAPSPNPSWPSFRSTGEQYRVYDFPETGESVPYRLFVPASWSPGARLPMLITLRAGTSINNNHREGNDLVRVAGERGYIVLSPLGYRPYPQPYYNSPYPIRRPPDDTVPGAGWGDMEDLRAELDVLYTIELVAAEYGVDRDRIFIHGQNPSGSGAMHLIEKYPDRFAAAVISSAPIVADRYPFDSIRGKVALLVVHGDQDTVNPLEASRELAETARAADVDARFAAIPGGTHLTAYLDFAEEIYDFLDRH